MTHAIVKRFDTLSDGIIAIIMTILVLEIKLPTGLADLPSFAYAIGTFLISFIIVFNFWFRRTQVVSNVEEIGFTSFMLDVLAHLVLALLPLATKMLVTFDAKWVAILFFDIINLLTGFLLSLLTIHLTVRSTDKQYQTKRDQIHDFYHKRLLLFSVMDIVVMLLALMFPHLGIFLYLLSPMIEFWFNYKRGLAFERAVKQGFSFENYIMGHFNQTPQSRSLPPRGKHRF